jgi:hypothetical protein
MGSVPEKLTIVCRVDRVRGVVEMTSQLLMQDDEYAEYGAALELALEELQRINEEIDLAMPTDISQPGSAAKQ